MTIKSVQLAIQHARDVIEEWAEVGLPGWRETQTRYAIIDPIIRALGWDTEDPKECYPEYDLSEGNTAPIMRSSATGVLKTSPRAQQRRWSSSKLRLCAGIW